MKNKIVGADELRQVVSRLKNGKCVDVSRYPCLYAEEDRFPHMGLQEYHFP